MKISALALVALLGMLGVALGYNYGYGYMPYQGGAGGGNDNTLCKFNTVIYFFMTSL